MGIKEYNSETQQWEDYCGDLVNGTVGRVFVNNRWKIAWSGIEIETYTKLSYLQGNGTSYIDTGIYGELNSKIEIELMITDSTQTIACVTGARNTSSIGIIFAVGSPDKNLHVDFYNYSVGRGRMTTSASVDEKYKLVGCKTYQRIYDSSGTAIINHSSNISNTFTTPTTIPLFNCDGYAFDTKFNGRIYSYKHYKNNILVQDLIPVKRDSDGAIGMFDLVTKTFYGSVNSTPFTQSGAVEGDKIRVRK